MKSSSLAGIVMILVVTTTCPPALLANAASAANEIEDQPPLALEFFGRTRLHAGEHASIGVALYDPWNEHPVEHATLTGRFSAVLGRDSETSPTEEVELEVTTDQYGRARFEYKIPPLATSLDLEVVAAKADWE